MIITEAKPIQEIIDSLQGYTRIFIIGCGECATSCNTGGQNEVAALKAQLEAKGKQVVGFSVPSAPCVAGKLKKELASQLKAYRESDAVVVLACGLGVQSVKDNDRFGLVVVPGCNSLCGAVMDNQGNFYEKCSLCGECVLSQTAGICPVTICPKGLLNGPCGGMDKGKCEVNKDNDCAWVLIYQEMEKRKKLENFALIKKPRNFNKATKPHKFPSSYAKK